MFRLINRTTLAFLGLFLFICAGFAAYDAYFVWPQRKCESDGAWWDPKDRQCLDPIPIWRLTGRKLVPAAGARAAEAAHPAAAPAAAPKP
ncbi:MAG TPA: hypothetical protein VG939_14230 [Caulobacteraceae bacterium]|nr:hypothetical protein [Caulobacteraceae bacterium]